MGSDLLERAAAEIRRRRHNNGLWSDEDIARAVIALVLEEAAKTAEKYGADDDEIDMQCKRQVAAAIRALIPTREGE